MIIWGSRSEAMDLGKAQKKYCPICEKERFFHVFLSYTYSHLYYLFGWASNKQYILACEICNRGTALDGKIVENKLDKNPIPFMHRKGWLVGIVGFFGFFVVLGLLGEIFDL